MTRQYRAYRLVFRIAKRLEKKTGFQIFTKIKKNAYDSLWIEWMGKLV